MDASDFISFHFCFLFAANSEMDRWRAKVIRVGICFPSEFLLGREDFLPVSSKQDHLLSAG
jgi:hypothetical protein